MMQFGLNNTEAAKQEGNVTRPRPILLEMLLQRVLDYPQLSSDKAWRDAVERAIPRKPGKF